MDSIRTRPEPIRGHGSRHDYADGQIGRIEDRGVAIDRTYQLNVSGNMDFKNMLERTRLKCKKISETQSVTSQIDQGISDHNVHIGPSDHLPWMDDRKWAYIGVEGRNLDDVHLNVELKLEVWDTPTRPA